MKGNLPMKKRIVAMILTGMMIVTLTLNGCGTKEGEKLVIPISDLSKKATFYPVEVDGTEMEVIAGKDSKGEIRTAFNTCQVCYDSGNGYYRQQGGELVCQNCGNSSLIQFINNFFQPFKVKYAFFRFQCRPGKNPETDHIAAGFFQHIQVFCQNIRSLQPLFRIIISSMK